MKNPAATSAAAALQHHRPIVVFNNILTASLLVAAGFALGFVSSSYLSSGGAAGSNCISFFSNIGQFAAAATSLPENSTLIAPPPTRPPPPPPAAAPAACKVAVGIKKERVGLKGFFDPGVDAAHDMTEEELLWRASMVPARGGGGGGRAKVAFMFLTRGPMALAPLWERFFKGHEGLFSIYVHADPGFNESVPEGSVFHRRRIPSKAVEWGKMSMLEAERRLLANALLDFSNTRFVLLSESCIPLFDFPTVRSYLTASPETTNFVGVFDDPGATGRGRYSRRMSPQICLSQWRKGSQWFAADRRLAVEVVADEVYFPVFGRHCRRYCYPDEHYLPTLVNIRNYWRSNAERGPTWVDWSRGGPHPAAFGASDVTPELFAGMRNGGGGGGGNCSIPAAAATCFVFARKFMPESLEALLRIAPAVLGFGGGGDT